MSIFKKREYTFPCKVTCEEVGFDITVPDMSGELLTALFLSENEIQTPRGSYSVPEKYIDWVLEVPEYRKAFETLNDTIGAASVKDLVRVYFFLVLHDDPKAASMLILPKFLMKDSFLKAFQDYNNSYMNIEKGSKQLKICPDLLFCVLIYTMTHLRQSLELEIKRNCLPYIMYFVGATEEEILEEFDPTLPYENDEYIPAKNRKYIKKAKK